MTYEEIGINSNGQTIYGRIDDDGLCRFTCTEENSEYQAWLNPKDANKL
jgi:hypothetical protein